ncbi:uncharacterized protein BCR38DRAFT_429597 [Pseudomassariella vexata]|uniref:Nab2-like CCCH zinc finger domain-containing protein n=1 Tax=Pseudomassariella vexata TaxID=1141098 RepID=A0A1Y2E435_9PEZI|nr:uncharacterized protein BCR38DRAFT_429597 [Pseudomassariella vexata]ORY66207.1 hypothetical protein BCR38DRAFT_429597 [Pseudomassariella vexata]
MSIESNTPLAEALGSVIKPKLIENGWATEDNDQPMAEYIVMMLVNGKTQDEIATELAGEILGLGSDDPTVRDFARWTFEQIQALNAQQNGGAFAQGPQDAVTTMDQDMDMSTGIDATEFNAPTGPKSMRNGDARGGARGKRMLNNLNRAMDRTHENVLHRVRGNERIAAHNRTPPTGPRGAGGRNSRATNNRASTIAHGMAQQMPGMPGAMNGMNDMNWMMPPGAQGGDIFALLQQQNQMMAALSQQLAASQSPNSHGNNGRGRGKSLFERTQRGNFRGRSGYHGNGQHAQPNESADANGATAEGGDIDMSQSRVDSNPATTVCKYNLKCTNKDCKFAHQSPAAPPGITVDVTDVCTYGAACKNFKCVGNHPSPATRRAHQSEQECKFFPNCTNPKCPFKHPDMPICRNGADCKVEGCNFTHIQTVCRFNPCTNRYCHFKHEDGQRGTFQDKVWTPASGTGAKDHVSERKFVDQNETEELVMPGGSAEMDGVA